MSRRLPIDAETLRRAQLVYERLHWGAPAPRQFSQWEAPDPHKGPLVELGALVAVEYLTIKEGDGLSLYRHEFGKEDGTGKGCPVLGVNAERKLIVVGGRYLVTKRGIVG